MTAQAKSSPPLLTHRREQVPGEHFTVGENIKVFVVDVKEMGKGPRIMISRIHFLDAAVAGGISHEPFQYQPDAGLALAALADNEHHLLPFGAGNETVA